MLQCNTTFPQHASMQYNVSTTCFNAIQRFHNMLQCNTTFPQHASMQLQALNHSISTNVSICTLTLESFALPQIHKFSKFLVLIIIPRYNVIDHSHMPVPSRGMTYNTTLLPRVSTTALGMLCDARYTHHTFTPIIKHH